MKAFRNKAILLVVASTFLGLLGCTKPEGPGGAATVIGHVNAIKVDGAGNPLEEYDAQKHKIYIIYGEEDNYYDDRTETNHNGNFKFEFLRTGKYTIYLFEDCIGIDSYPGCSNVITHEIEITDKKGTVDLGTINVYK
jgi:hypothetical protein